MSSSSFCLLEILPEDADAQKGREMVPSVEPPSMILSPTFVSFVVGPKALRYRCPLYLLQAGAASIQSLFVDQVQRSAEEGGRESGLDEAEKTTASFSAREGEAFVAPNDAASSFLPIANISIRLPDVREVCFETVALYLEHFYGVATSSHPKPYIRNVDKDRMTSIRNGISSVEGSFFLDSRANAPGKPLQKSRDEEEGSQGKLSSAREQPTVLTPPLKFQDLYALSEWEQRFVLERLIQWRGCRVASLSPDNIAVSRDNCGSPQPPAASPAGTTSSTSASKLTVDEILLYNGAWIDALGSSSCHSAPCEEIEAAELNSPNAGRRGRPGENKPGNSTQRTKSYQTFLVSFTVEEKQKIMSRLCETMRAAEKLRVLALRHLCAALIANMVIHLDEKEARTIVAKPGERNAQEIPSMSTKRRAELLEKYAWLGAILSEKEKQ